MDSQGRVSAVNPPRGSDGRPVSEILSDIGTRIQEIVRSEVRLARLEITEMTQRVRLAAVPMASGAVLAFFGIEFILLAAMFALWIVLPLWLAAVIMGALLVIAAGIAISYGRRRFKAIRPPLDTLQTLKEDLQWIKEESRP